MRPLFSKSVKAYQVARQEKRDASLYTNPFLYDQEFLRRMAFCYLPGNLHLRLKPYVFSAENPLDIAYLRGKNPYKGNWTDEEIVAYENKSNAEFGKGFDEDIAEIEAEETINV